jgi:hypothetical protein
MRSYYLTGRTCPVCHAPLDGASETHGNHAPKPGDFSVCMYCTAALRFTEQLLLEVVTMDVAREELGPKGFADLRRTIAVIRSAHHAGMLPDRSRKGG